MSGGGIILPQALKGISNIPAGSPLVGQGTSQALGLPLFAAINLAFLPAQTSVANDSLKISGQTAALSSTNPLYVTMRSTATAGREVVLTATADVTLNLTGAHWKQDTYGDLTGAVLRVYAINDNGTLKWGIGWGAARTVVTDTETTTTPTSVTTPETVLVNSAISSGTWPCREVGYFFADFDDTGGSSENLWAVSTNVNKLLAGKSADGVWSPFGTNMTGFSANQTWSNLRYTTIGAIVFIMMDRNATGTSNATTFTVEGPVTSKSVMNLNQGRIFNNGAAVVGYGVGQTRAGSTTIDLYLNGGLAAWTAGATAKGSSVQGFYEANVN